MDEKNKSPSLNSIWIKILTILNSCLIGSVFVFGLNYFLVDIYKAQENKANAALSNVETKIREVDLSTEAFKNMLESERVRLQTEESKANATLLNVETKIKGIDLSIMKYEKGLELEGKELKISLDRLETEVKNVKDNLEIYQKKSQVSTTVAEFLNNLQPNLELKSIDEKFFVDRSSKRTTFYFSLKNSGKFNIIIDKPTIIIATKEITQGQEITEGLLKMDEDYSFNNQPITVGLFPPGRVQNYHVDIAFKKDMPEQIYLYIRFETRTHDKIINFVVRSTEGLLDKEDLVEHSKASYSFIQIARLR